MSNCECIKENSYSYYGYNINELVISLKSKKKKHAGKVIYKQTNKQSNALVDFIKAT